LHRVQSTRSQGASFKKRAKLLDMKDASDFSRIGANRVA